MQTIAGYKFTLAFENAVAEDYVTEKLYHPLVAGSVPVYLGAPNVGQLVPASDCYIDVNDFSGPQGACSICSPSTATPRPMTGTWPGKRPFEPSSRDCSMSSAESHWCGCGNGSNSSNNGDAPGGWEPYGRIRPLPMLRAAGTAERGSMKRRCILPLVLIAAALASQSATASAAPMYFGATIDGDVYGQASDPPWNTSVWNTFEQHAGKKTAILNMGQAWGQFDTSAFQAVRNHGAVPLVDHGSTAPASPTSPPATRTR